MESSTDEYRMNIEEHQINWGTVNMCAQAPSGNDNEI